MKKKKWENLCERSKKEPRALIQMWKKIKTITEQSKKTNSYRIKIDNTEKPTDQDIANCFAATLEKTFALDTTNFKHHQEAEKIKILKSSDQTVLTTMTELDNILGKLPKKKASGPDDIQYEHIINLPIQVKQDLLFIYNESLTSGIIPDIWKASKIKMLLKPNKPENLVSSYRPISLTSCLAKCFEKIILNRVVKHLKTNKNVSIFQSGFREGHS